MGEMPMKILIVGGGGREHALFDRLRQSPLVSEILCAPGNGGIPYAARRRVKADDLGGLLRLARLEKPDLTIIGPEVALVKGIQDVFAIAGFTVFGPSQAAAQLEGSKEFCKDICVQYGIPTAEFAATATLEAARRMVQHWGAPIVVKDDGLAAGKGVKVADTVDEALAFAEMLFSQKDRSGSVLIERKLVGRECSVMALCDGVQAYLLAPARDYKRALDGDRGENTGGMGAYSPLPDVDDATLGRIKTNIIDKLLVAMAKRGHPYHGVLYAGIMLTEDGEMLLEVNCRFGDPETQVVLPRLKSDLLPYLVACTTLGGLASLPSPEWHDDAAVCVVLASREYPEKPVIGLPIRIESPGFSDATLYHAGTELSDEKYFTAGGRVLCSVGMGATLSLAAEAAYRQAHSVGWDGMRYRNDIGMFA